MPDRATVYTLNDALFAQLQYNKACDNRSGGRGFESLLTQRAPRERPATHLDRQLKEYRVAYTVAGSIHTFASGPP
jgi:hypothetical protein